MKNFKKIVDVILREELPKNRVSARAGSFVSLRMTSFFCFLMICLSLTGCYSNQVILVNQSETELNDLHLYAGSQEVWTGNLKSGNERKISFSIKENGSFSIFQGLADGSIFRAEDLGYFTPDDGQRHEVRIGKEKKVFYLVRK